VGTVIGLLYLAKAHGKFKWRFVLPGVFAVVAAVFVFWHSTEDTGPWYLKRMDLSRPSAQHRIAAWKAGFEIMRDHPFGVGWNHADEIYRTNYSPPEKGFTAILTNDYLMLGTQLGWPGLICFLTYVALCYRKIGNRKSEISWLVAPGL
jgi:O-antigen ligase